MCFTLNLARYLSSILELFGANSKVKKLTATIATTLFPLSVLVMVRLLPQYWLCWPMLP